MFAVTKTVRLRVVREERARRSKSRFSRSQTRFENVSGPKVNRNPQIGWRANWRQAADAADALPERRVRGKIVLDLGRDKRM